MRPREIKMYQDMKRQFWWNGMKKDITQFVTRCLTYQKVKVEHKCLGGLLQPSPILQWKWEDITMDFVTGLLKIRGQKDII
jgi:hypothetical protein